MSPIVFEIPGPPRAQQRPRATRRGDHVSVYDAPDSRNAKATVVELARAATLGAEPTADPIECRITAYWEWPRSQWRKRNPRSEAVHAAGPDADNVAKLILDACNGVVYLDDRQVARLVVEKLRATQGSPARTTVEFRLLAGANGSGDQ